MQALTRYERVRNTLSHQPVDPIDCHVPLWGETLERWKKEGSAGPRVRAMRDA